MYGSILIRRVTRKGRVRQVVEKVCEKMAFMDLDKVNRVGGRLPNGVKSLYKGSSSACVRVNGSLNEWFDINVGMS